MKRGGPLRGTGSLPTTTAQTSRDSTNPSSPGVNVAASCATGWALLVETMSFWHVVTCVAPCWRGSPDRSLWCSGASVAACACPEDPQMYPTTMRTTAKTNNRPGTNREHLETCIMAEFTGRPRSCQGNGAAAVSRKALRLYEARGILPPARRTAFGYRRCPDTRSHT